MDEDAFRCHDFDLWRELTYEENDKDSYARAGIKDICDLLTAEPVDKQHLWEALPSEAHEVLIPVCGDDLMEMLNGDSDL